MSEWFSEGAIKIWSLVATFLIVPAIGWVNSKRKSYSELNARVGMLEGKVDLHGERLETLERTVVDKLNKIQDDLTEVKVASKVNAAKLEERR